MGIADVNRWGKDSSLAAKWSDYDREGRRSKAVQEKGKALKDGIGGLINIAGQASSQDLREMGDNGSNSNTGDPILEIAKLVWADNHSKDVYQKQGVNSAAVPVKNDTQEQQGPVQKKVDVQGV